MRKILPILFVFIPALAFSSHTAYAQSALGLSAIPPRLEITAAPGEVVTDILKIRNESNTNRVITTTVKDFIVSDSQGTPTQVDDEDATDNRWAASQWVHVSPTSLQLKPGETKNLNIAVIVPEDALPGGHYAVVLHSPQNEAVLSETGSAIETNVGSLIYVTVEGDIKEEALLKQFAAPKFSEFGPIPFSAIISNLSDVHITPAGTVEVKNWLGGKTAQLPLTSLNIFPYTDRQFDTSLEKKFLFGRYSAKLTAAYGSSGQLINGTIFFWVMPWRIILLVTISIILLLAIFFLLRRKPTKVDDVQQLPPVDEPEVKKLKDKYRDNK